MEEKIKVLVVNASPKGDYSLTLQHSIFMLNHQSNAEYKILQVGEELSKINYNEECLNQRLQILNGVMQ